MLNPVTKSQMTGMTGWTNHEDRLSTQDAQLGGDCSSPKPERSTFRSLRQGRAFRLKKRLKPARRQRAVGVPSTSHQCVSNSLTWNGGLYSPSSISRSTLNHVIGQRRYIRNSGKHFSEPLNCDSATLSRVCTMDTACAAAPAECESQGSESLDAVSGAVGPSNVRLVRIFAPTKTKAGPAYSSPCEAKVP